MASKNCLDPNRGNTMAEEPLRIAQKANPFCILDDFDSHPGFVSAPLAGFGYDSSYRESADISWYGCTLVLRTGYWASSLHVRTQIRAYLNAWGLSR